MNSYYQGQQFQIANPSASFTQKLGAIGTYTKNQGELATLSIATLGIGTGAYSIIQSKPTISDIPSIAQQTIASLVFFGGRVQEEMKNWVTNEANQVNFENLQLEGAKVYQENPVFTGKTSEVLFTNPKTSIDFLNELGSTQSPNDLLSAYTKQFNSNLIGGNEDFITATEVKGGQGETPSRLTTTYSINPESSDLIKAYGNAASSIASFQMNSVGTPELGEIIGSNIENSDLSVYSRIPVSESTRSLQSFFTYSNGGTTIEASVKATNTFFTNEEGTLSVSTGGNAEYSLKGYVTSPYRNILGLEPKEIDLGTGTIDTVPKANFQINGVTESRALGASIITATPTQEGELSITSSFKGIEQSTGAIKQGGFWWHRIYNGLHRT